MVVYHLPGGTGWSTVVVNGTRQIPNRNFHGDALVPLPRIFHQRRSKPNGLELVKISNGTHIFHSEILFGNFGLPFKKIPFSRENSIRNFRKFCVNGKQPALHF